jgi:hypothetical protein
LPDFPELVLVFLLGKRGDAESGPIDRGEQVFAKRMKTLGLIEMSKKLSAGSWERRVQRIGRIVSTLTGGVSRVERGRF